MNKIGETKFVLTVDTEEDNQWRWRPPAPFTFENIYQLGKFQDFCQSREVKPTYFVTDSVLNDERSLMVLKDFSLDYCEFGSHMHPWSNYPFDERSEGSTDSRKQLFPSQLTPILFEKKLTVLSDSIESKLGVKPTSFRAGKWGFAEWMAPILEEKGYQVDSSVTPGINWQVRVGNLEKNGVPDYSQHGLSLYKFKDLELIEVPMTIVNLGLELGPLTRWMARQRRVLPVRAYEKYISKPTWLRIYKNTTTDDLVRVIKKSEEINLPIIQFMIHSSELIAGGSPYAKNQNDIEKIYNHLDFLLNYISSRNISNFTLREAVDQVKF